MSLTIPKPEERIILSNEHDGLLESSVVSQLDNRTWELKAYGIGSLLTCPELCCSVAVWDSAMSSLPADSETRKLRRELFCALRDASTSERAEIMAELNRIGAHIGGLNFGECVQILRDLEGSRRLARDASRTLVSNGSTLNAGSDFMRAMGIPTPGRTTEVRVRNSRGDAWEAEPVWPQPRRKTPEPAKPQPKIEVVENNLRELDID